MRHVSRLLCFIILLIFPILLTAQKYEEKVGTVCNFTLVKQNGKFGVSEYSNIILDKKYDEIIIPKTHDCRGLDYPFFVRKKKKWGVANKKGEITLAMEYDSLKISNTYPDMFFLYKSGKTGLYFFTENRLIAAEFEKINTSSKLTGRVYIKKKEGWGMMDLKGNITIEPIFQGLFEPGEYLLLCAKKDNSYGFITPSGKIVIPFEYENSTKFSGDFLAPLRKDGKWGYLDTAGKKIIDFRFESATEMSNEWAEVTLNGEKGRIDLKGNFIRNPSYDYEVVFTESNGFRKVKKDGKFGYINKHNKLVVPCNYQEGYPVELGAGIVKKNEKYGLISMNNQVLIPMEHEDIWGFQPGTFIVKDKNGKYALFNRKGVRLCDWLDDIFAPKDGYGTCKKGGKTGKIAPSGMIIWDETPFKTLYETTYFLCESAKMVHLQKSNDYIINLDIVRDGGKILLLSARTVNKTAENYSLEITQLNSKNFAPEKTSTPIILPFKKKTGLRKFEKTGSGYLLVTYSVAVWFDQNLKILHKKEFGTPEQGYSHDFCADVIETEEGSNKFVILSVKKDGQGLISGFDLSTKKETENHYYLGNPFLLISNTSGKLFRVNDENILIIHKGENNREMTNRHSNKEYPNYTTTLINFTELFSDEGIREKSVWTRNTQYKYFSDNIGSFYEVEAVWMGKDGYLHFVAGTESKPYTAYEVAVSIEPNNGNYKKVYSKKLFSNIQNNVNDKMVGLVNTLYIRQSENGFHLTSGFNSSSYGMVDLFDQKLNYLGSYCLPDNLVSRKFSSAYQHQYTVAGWTTNKRFEENVMASFKYQNLYTHYVNEYNTNRSMSMCESGNAGKYLIMFQHMVVEAEFNTAKRLKHQREGLDEETSSYTPSSAETNSSNSNQNSGSSSSSKNTSNATTKTDTRQNNTEQKKEEHSGSIYFKFSYSDKNSKTAERMYIHYGSNAAYKVSTTPGSSATVKCQPGKVYVSYTGEKKDMKEVMDVKPEDCGKTFDSSKF